jgi:GDSL-like Lipase/Acylhydrolase family
MKRLLACAALAAGSLTIAVLVGEIAVRAALKDQSVLFPRYHTDYHYGNYTLRGIRANSQFWHTSADGSWKFSTNSHGLRDTREFSYAKPAGTVRVLSLGDSHTQGYEVRQQATFSAVLERYLAARGVHAEVLNAGVSGFSTAEELAYLENEGYRYAPDVVVLGFYANDFEDNLKAGLFALEHGKLIERKREHIPGVRIQNAIYSVPGVQWLGENSYFYSLLFNNVWEYFKAMLAAHAKGEATEYAVTTRTANSDYEIGLALALIERMSRFCAERGIRLVVADIPQMRGAYRFTDSLPKPAQEALGKMGIEYVSSQSLLSEYDGVAEMHVPHGHNHVSEITHLMIGVELGRRVLKGALPAASPQLH